MEVEAPITYAFKPFVFARQEVCSKEKPKARSGHRVVCNEWNLYSYGGFNPGVNNDDPDMLNDQNWNLSKPLFKELWKFNFATKRWKRLPCQTMPSELASNAIVLTGATLLVHGGTGVPFGEKCNNNVYICNLSTGEMHIVPATGELPDPLYGQAVICHGSYLYTVGGTTGLEYTCDIHRFNLRTQVWESVYICAGRDQCEPKGRYRHELAFDGRTIYVFGGGTASEAFGFEELSAFDTQSTKWMSLYTRPDKEKGFPAPRRCHGLVQYNHEKLDSNSVVISGGYNGNQVFNDLWRLDLNNLQWTCLKTCLLPQPTYFHSATLTPSGQMFTFGGIQKIGDAVARTDEIHSVWLTIPKLSEICWEALNFYYPNLKQKSDIDLLRIGVPLKFVQRFDHESLS